MCTFFVLEIRQTNPPKPSRADLKNQKILVMEAKYHTQTLPSSMFLGDITLWI